jgi:hypothetical protein
LITRGKSAIVKIAVVILGLAAVWFLNVAWDYFDRDSPANASMQVQLKLFGSAMYEYHARTGRWPTAVEDLAQTSLPVQSYVWRQTATAIVFLWPQGLKDEPKDNANVLLAYWRGGLFNELGSVWVCWGDLRAERMKTSVLRGRLAGQPRTTRPGAVMP